jgi:hypothetical protein
MPKRRVNDPENPPLTAADFAQMRPALEVMPPAAGAAYRRSRGEEDADEEPDQSAPRSGRARGLPRDGKRVAGKDE